MSEATEQTYIENRIKALSRNGAIDALKQEAAALRVNIEKHYEESERRGQPPNNGWCLTQFNRQAAFLDEAERLEKERPKGAAGLAS